jgi:hypothetical protein
MVRCPNSRWKRFNVQRNDDGTFRVVVVAGNAEHMFADRFASEDAAEWACSLFNAAIGVRLIPGGAGAE